jgi:hypothetical protein
LHAWDFVEDLAWWDSKRVGRLANTPNWTFSRASTGYAQNSAGELVAFASGELRRTDKGVLIEGARTNLILQSQTFGTTWTVTRCLAFGSGSVADAVVAPDGTTTADKLVEDTTASNTHRLQQSGITVSASTAYTYTIYVKAAERSICTLQMTDGTNTGFAYFNLSNGSVGSTSGTSARHVEALADGWYRFGITMTTAVGATAMTVQVFMATSTSTNSYSGDGTSGLYLWGAQLEAASFPSSYIPTTTASATRAADSLTITGVTGLDYPLTLFAEFDFADADSSVIASSRAAFALGTSGTTAERNGIYNLSGGLGGLSQAGGVTQASPGVSGTVAVNTTVKTAYRVQQNNFNFAKNGSLGTTDVSGTASATPNIITFGFWPGSVGWLHGYLKRAAIFASAKTDAQLQSLTAS